MTFEHPEIFYVFPVLAVPVLVHLFNFRRYKRVMFSNVQFLKDIQQQQTSRTYLRERLILAARLLTLLFLLLAFAKPRLSNRQQSISGPLQIVSIFIDNSYSMQALNREGTLLDEAKQRAKEIVAAYGINNRFQLLTQDFEGKQQRLLTADEFNATADTVALSAQSHTLQQIINRQQNLFSLQAQAVKYSYIISDFQRNLLIPKGLNTDSSVQINFIKIDAAALANIAVDSVSLLNATHRPGAQEQLVVRLHNYSDKDAQAVPVKLLINNQQKAIGSISIKANKIINDTLTFSGLQTGWQQAELQIQDNPVIFDNRFYFTFNVQPQLPLLLINGSSPNRYLTAAYSTDPFFKVTQTVSGNVNYASLNQYPLVVISDVIVISAGLSQQLQSYIRSGGTLALFPAENLNVGSYRQLLAPLNCPWPAQQVTKNIKVVALNTRHPLLKNVFDKLPDKPDLPLVQKYYKFAGTTQSDESTIMRLPGNNLFFSRYQAGKGRIYLSAVPLNKQYSNLPKHALLLPLLFKMALLSKGDNALYQHINQDEYVKLPAINLNEKSLLHLTKGSIQLIPDVQQNNGSPALYLADQVKQQGIYQLKLNDSLLAAVAFNASPAESDVHYLSKNEINRLTPNGKAIQTGTAPFNMQLAQANKGMQLWKVCIILALCCITAEIALIRRLKTGSSTPSS